MQLLDHKHVSIVISTFNRKKELTYTLLTLQHVIDPKGIYVWDDSSTDGTFESIASEFPEINLFLNKSNNGYIFNRNKLMNSVETKYVISIDDDANFVNPEMLINALNFMNWQLECGVLAFRIYWGLTIPNNTNTNHELFRVSNYVGCGHLFRLEAWRNSVKSYPEWYKFYGEEDFASLKLFKDDWKIFYFPDVLIHHRVSIKNRQNNHADKTIRTKLSLQSSWSNYLIFYPNSRAWYKIIYSIKEQLRLKFFKGDFNNILPIIRALRELCKHKKYRKNLDLKLSKEELRDYLELPPAPIYWEPKSSSD